MKIYIAGPMTGIPDFNRLSFNEAARLLSEKGHIVLNPAVLPDGMKHEEYMTICLAMVEVCDMVALLPGWEKSKGACMEIIRAFDLDKEICEIAMKWGLA
jgi:hypothetical protein